MRPSSSPGAPPAVSPSDIAELARGLEQPFTFGALVRAAERRRDVRVGGLLDALREAERAAVVRPTGERHHSETALRGERLYTLA